MDGSRFDSLLLAITQTASRRGTVRLLAATALGTLILGQPVPGAAKKKKVTLCHAGQTLSVSKKAKKKHLQHGDTLGACPSPPPPPVSPPAAFCVVPSLPEDRCGSLCNGNVDCDGGCGICIPTVEGPGLCMQGVSCATAQRCSATAECPAVQACSGAAPNTDCFNVCRPTCPRSVCGTANACLAPATCGSGGQCFPPDAGGSTRCGTVAPASCGFTSDQQCITQFGQGAFLVRFTPNERCSCGAGSPHTTFCAIPA